MSGNCAIIGDIKGSRSLDHWPSVFRELGRALEDINEEFSKDVLVDFRPTVGDEFQGALVDASNAYSVYVSIKGRLPVGIYCGIGIGDIEKPLSKDIGMRGSAFYRARSALESCKKGKRHVLVRSAETVGELDQVTNTLLYFIQVLERSWTKRQHQVLTYYRQNRGDTYEQLGLHFGISKQAVSQILKAGDWDAIREGEAVVNKLLERMYVPPEQGPEPRVQRAFE